MLDISDSNRIKGDEVEGSYEKEFQLPTNEVGAWYLAWLKIVDKEGNENFIREPKLKEENFATRFIVQLKDVTAPTLFDFSFKPASVTVGTGKQDVKAILTINDDITGFRSAELKIQSPKTHDLTIDISDSDRVNGDEFEGTYEKNLELPSKEIGNWSLVWLKITDKEGNENLIDEKKLTERNLPTMFGLKSSRKKETSKTVNSINPVKTARTYFLRSTPTTLSESDVKKMIKKYDYSCKEYPWSKDWANPKGVGIDHDYAKMKDGKIILDTKTGLMWQQSGSGKRIRFSKLTAYIDSLNKVNFAGYKDWRLPTLEEAMSLLEQEKKNGDLYISQLFDKTQRYIWTSDIESASNVWVVDFSYGYCYDLLVGLSYYVRAVRS